MPRNAERLRRWRDSADGQAERCARRSPRAPRRRSRQPGCGGGGRRRRGPRRGHAGGCDPAGRAARRSWLNPERPMWWRRHTGRSQRVQPDHTPCPTAVSYTPRHEHRSRRRRRAAPHARDRRSGGQAAVDHQPRGLRAPACRGSGDPVPESHQLPRFGLPDADGAAQHQLRRQGRVHGLVEDQVLVPGDGDDPDRPLGRRQEPRRPRSGRGRAAAGRAVRDLSGGHAQPRRLPLPGTHRRRPVGDEARLPDLPGRHRRHRQDPAARRQVAQAVP